VNAFKLLADPIRFRIVEILASGEHTSGTISDAITGNYGVSRAAVAKHLAILRDEGWVDWRGSGSDGATTWANSLCIQNCRYWRSRSPAA
jgi:predicted transcriptional regulator